MGLSCWVGVARCSGASICFSFDVIAESKFVCIFLNELNKIEQVQVAPGLLSRMGIARVYHIARLFVYEFFVWQIGNDRAISVKRAQRQIQRYLARTNSQSTLYTSMVI